MNLFIVITRHRLVGLYLNQPYYNFEKNKYFKIKIKNFSNRFPNNEEKNTIAGLTLEEAEHIKKILDKQFLKGVSIEDLLLFNEKKIRKEFNLPEREYYDVVYQTIFDIDSCEKEMEEENPFCLAIHWNHKKVLRHLLSQINSDFDIFQYTRDPIVAAILVNDMQAFSELVKYKVPTDRVHIIMKHRLEAALKSKNLEALKQLLKKDFLFEKIKLSELIKIAQEVNFPEGVFCLLRQEGVVLDFSCLDLLIKQDTSLEKIISLLQLCQVEKLRDEHNHTVMYIAMKKTNLTFFAWLLYNYPDLCKVPNKDNVTVYSLSQTLSNKTFKFLQIHEKLQYRELPKLQFWQEVKIFVERFKVDWGLEIDFSFLD